MLTFSHAFGGWEFDAWRGSSNESGEHRLRHGGRSFVRRTFRPRQHHRVVRMLWGGVQESLATHENIPTQTVLKRHEGTACDRLHQLFGRPTTKTSILTSASLHTAFYSNRMEEVDIPRHNGGFPPAYLLLGLAKICRGGMHLFQVLYIQRVILGVFLRAQPHI